jgi:hypothetical protein
MAGINGMKLFLLTEFKSLNTRAMNGLQHLQTKAACSEEKRVLARSPEACGIEVQRQQDSSGLAKDQEELNN